VTKPDETEQLMEARSMPLCAPSPALPGSGATARLSGRREDEAALRDAWCFRASGDDAGPSGQILRAWRQLAHRSSGWSANAIKQAAKTFGIDLDEGAGEFVTLLEFRGCNKRENTKTRVDDPLAQEDFIYARSPIDNNRRPGRSSAIVIVSRAGRRGG